VSKVGSGLRLAASATAWRSVAGLALGLGLDEPALLDLRRSGSRTDQQAE
jgi:hypothetical protein